MTTQPAAGERINPAYYGAGGKLECIDVIERFGLGFCRGNALKYLWRHRGKNGREDLVKALWYLEREAANAGPATHDRTYGMPALAVQIPGWILDAAPFRTASEEWAFEAIACGDARIAIGHIEHLIVALYPAPAAGEAAQRQPQAFATDPATGRQFEIHPQT